MGFDVAAHDLGFVSDHRPGGHYADMHDGKPSSATSASALNPSAAP